MQYITGFFQKVKRKIIVKFLYIIVVKIISIDIGRPDGIGPALGKRTIANIKQPAYDYSTVASMSPDLPAATKAQPLSYIDLLKQAQAAGKPINPIKHRKPIAKSVECPFCSAPYKYVYSNAVLQVKHRKKKVQKYKCKICSYQWYPNRLKKYALFSCPFCNHRLYHKLTRYEFDKFICPNQNCPYLKSAKKPYLYRDYFFNIDELALATPQKAPINLANIRHSNNVLGLALVLHVNFRLSYRRTTDFLKEIFDVKVSSSTVYNWCESAACLLAPLVTKLPITTSNLLVIDETYERYAGYWGYYYACLDAKNRYLVAPHFSTKRNVEAATTCMVGALQRINNPPNIIYLVHDHHPGYFLAVQLINQSGKFNFKIKSLPVKGLKDLPGSLPNPYRAYKNIIERYFGKAKPIYYLTRGFGSVKGAITHNFLYAIDYNYFHPHEVFDYQPPMKIEGLRSNHPIEKWNKLISMAIELKDT